MKDISIVVFNGRLVKDIEIKQFDNASIGLFTVAKTRSVKKQDQWIEETDFIDCKKWNPGKLADYLKKGQQVSISGDIVQESWEKDGQKRSRLIIQVDNIQLLQRPKGQEEMSDFGPGVTSDDVFPKKLW